MLSLNTLRTQFGVLLSVIIGGALLAFILSLKADMGFASNDPEVGEIAGEEVAYSEFLAAYEDVKMQMGGDSFDYEQSEQAISNVWQMLFTERLLIPNLEELGIAVSEAERKAMLNGEIPSGVYRSVFADPRTGYYDVRAITEFLAQAESNPQVSQMWALIDKQARVERAVNKYMDLVRGGAYANALTLNKGVVAVNNTFKGRFVACKYNTVADSLVTVNKSEVKKYYKAHKEQYKQAPYRTVSYVLFEVEATDADKQAIEEEVKLAAKEFAAAKDVKLYSRENRHASIAGNYVAAKSLESDEAKALNAGRTFGPELKDGEWYASRVVETRNVADSLELAHIVLSYTDTELADSLLTVAKGRNADFAALASQYSVAETAANGGKIGKVAYSSLAQEFADALKSARRGDVVMVPFGNAIQIFKVLGTGRVQKHYRLATMTYPIEPSQATKRAVHSEASLFSVNAKGSVEKFNEATSTHSVMPTTMNVAQGERNVRGLANSLEVVRWADEAKVGDVSDLIKIDDNYVVAVVTAVSEKEYKSLDEVALQIETILTRQKKFALLKEKMQGASLDEIAANTGVAIEEFEDAKSSAYYVKGIGVEPRVLGAISAVTAEKAGSLLPVVEGLSGAYAIVVDEVATEQAQSVEAERVKAQAEAEALAVRRALFAVQEAAEIKDLSVKYF